MTGPLLDVRDLSVEFPLRRQRLQALDGISFALEAGECWALLVKAAPASR